MTTMRKITGMAWAGGVMALALCAGAPLLAGVKDGVDAWDRGDYPAAVKEWQKTASKGDADATYNLAQAYRFGRGVPQDMTKAEELYARAAAAGHPLAADSYGVLLFQNGQHAAALPYLQTAAGRGDPRAQYLLGVAHFNGDLIEKDWPRAYALVTLASGQGLAQARQAIAQMDQYIPQEQRQQGTALATRMQAEAQATRAQQLASADLGGTGRIAEEAVRPPAPSAPSAPRPATIVDADHATGTEDPMTAGADYARPYRVPDKQPGTAAPGGQPAPASAPISVPTSVPKTAPVKVSRVIPAPQPARGATPDTATAASSTGPWQLQLGAFSMPGNADQLWQKLGDKGVLAGKTKILVPGARLTRLLAGGFASQSDAATACASLKKAGQSCLVTR